MSLLEWVGLGVGFGSAVVLGLSILDTFLWWPDRVMRRRQEERR